MRQPRGQFRALCTALGRVDLMSDPHYADDRIVIKKLSVGEMDNNVYVIVDPTTADWASSETAPQKSS